MGRRKWKPSRAQKDAYIRKMKEKEALGVFTTPYAIREGCYIEYYSIAHGCVIKGEVTSSSYGTKTGQHTFTIGGVKVKGRNLYPNVLKHVQGEESKNL